MKTTPNMLLIFCILLFLNISNSSVPIEIKIPMKISNLYPVNQYIYTNRGLQPLSVQNILKYKEMPNKFELEPAKTISFEEVIDNHRNRMLLGSFNAYSGRKRIVR